MKHLKTATTTLNSNADTTQLNIWRACSEHSQFTALQFTRKVCSVFTWTESLPYYVHTVYWLCIFRNKIITGKMFHAQSTQEGDHKNRERKIKKDCKKCNWKYNIKKTLILPMSHHILLGRNMFLAGQDKLYICALFISSKDHNKNESYIFSSTDSHFLWLLVIHKYSSSSVCSSKKDLLTSKLGLFLYYYLGYKPAFYQGPNLPSFHHDQPQAFLRWQHWHNPWRQKGKERVKVWFHLATSAVVSQPVLIWCPNEGCMLFKVSTDKAILSI